METLDVRKYELMAILSPDLGEKDSQKKVAEIREILGAQKAKITHEDIWGLREMAYRINGKETGFYLILNFEISPEALREIQKTLRLDQEIFRVMVMALPEDYIPKTMGEYEIEGEKEEKARQERIKKNEKPGSRPVMPQEKVEKVVKEAKKPEKADRKKLEEVEAKLKNIIENPDIEL